MQGAAAPIGPQIKFYKSIVNDQNSDNSEAPWGALANHIKAVVTTATHETSAAAAVGELPKTKMDGSPVSASVVNKSTRELFWIFVRILRTIVLSFRTMSEDRGPRPSYKGIDEPHSRLLEIRHVSSNYGEAVVKRSRCYKTVFDRHGLSPLPQIRKQLCPTQA